MLKCEECGKEFHRKCKARRHARKVHRAQLNLIELDSCKITELSDSYLLQLNRDPKFEKPLK